MQDETTADVNKPALPNASEQMMRTARANAEAKAANKNEAQQANGGGLDKLFRGLIPQQGKGEATTLNINQNSVQQPPSNLDIAKMQSLVKSEDDIERARNEYKQITDFIIAQSADVDQIRANIVSPTKYFYEPQESTAEKDKSVEKVKDDLLKVLNKSLNSFKLISLGDKVYKSPIDKDGDKDKDEDSEGGSEGGAKKAMSLSEEDPNALKTSSDEEDGKPDESPAGKKTKNAAKSTDGKGKADGKDGDKAGGKDEDEEEEEEPKKGTVRAEDWKDKKSPLATTFSDAISRGKTIGLYEKTLKGLFASLEVVKKGNPEFEDELSEIIKDLEISLKAIKSSKAEKKDRMMTIYRAIEQQQETNQRLIENTPAATVFVLFIINFFLKAIDFVTKFNPSKDPFLMQKTMENNLRNFRDCMKELSEVKEDDEDEKDRLTAKGKLIIEELLDIAFLYQYNPPFGKYPELEGVYRKVQNSLKDIKKAGDGRVKEKIIDDIFKSVNMLKEAINDDKLSTTLKKESDKTRVPVSYSILQLQKKLDKKLNQSGLESVQKEMQDVIDDARRHDSEQEEQGKANISCIRECLMRAKQDYSSQIISSESLSEDEKEGLLRYNLSSKINSLEKLIASIDGELANQEQTHTLSVVLARIDKCSRKIIGFGEEEVSDGIKNARQGQISESIYEATFGVINKIEDLHELSEAMRVGGKPTPRAQQWIRQIKQQHEIQMQRNGTLREDLIRMKSEVYGEINKQQTHLEQNIKHLKIQSAQKRELMDRFIKSGREKEERESHREGREDHGKKGGGAKGGDARGGDTKGVSGKGAHSKTNLGIGLGGAGKHAGHNDSSSSSNDEDSKKHSDSSTDSNQTKVSSSSNSPNASTDSSDDGHNSETESDSGSEFDATQSEAVRQTATAAQNAAMQDAAMQDAAMQAQKLNQMQKQMANGGVPQFTEKLGKHAVSDSQSRGI